MSTRVELKKQFIKESRRLARKYPLVLLEIEKLVQELKNDERPGDIIPNVGLEYEVYKVRLANPSAQTGKSGGFRVIYYVKLADNVALLTIYSKSDYEDIPITRIQALIEEALSEESQNNGDDE